MADHILYTLNMIKASILEGYSSLALTYIGLLFVVYKLVCLLLYITHVLKTFGLTRLGFGCLDVTKLGTWAVVTGGTSGIGKAYAEQLAEKGMSIVLVSRNADKLKNVATEIESKYKVQMKTVAIDFTTDNIEDYKRVGNELEGLDIGVLVNSSGMFYIVNGKLLDHENRGKLFPDIIKCNTVSINMMTDIVLPGMLKRRRGAVINIASGSAFQPIPGMTVYSATKAYVDVLTRSLQTEYRSSGVMFQAVLPFLVSTNMTKMKSSLLVTGASDFVRSSLATLGNENRTAGHLVHEIQRLFACAMPEGIYKKLAFQMSEDIRNKYLARQKRKDK